jgi:hypothetical protein
MRVSPVQGSQVWVGVLVRELQFSRYEQLLLQSGSWGTGIVLEPRVKGTSTVGNRYQATTGEGTADWEDLVRAVVSCKVCELAIAL